METARSEIHQHCAIVLGYRDMLLRRAWSDIQGNAAVVNEVDGV